MDVLQEEMNDALQQYQKQTSHPLSVAVMEEFQHMHSPEDFACQIEASATAFKEFRQQHGRLWSILKKFVEPLSNIAQVSIQPASSLPFGAAASAVFGAIYYLLKACEDVSKAYDWIEQVFTELLEFSTRLEIYSKTSIETTLRRKISAILAFILQVIGRSEMLVRKQRFRQYLKVLFLGKDPVTSKFVENLNKLFGSEQQLVLAVTYANTQKTEQKVEDLHRVAQRTDRNVATVIDALKATETKALETDKVLNEAVENTHEDVKSVLESLKITRSQADENTNELSGAIQQTDWRVQSVIGSLKTTQKQAQQSTKELSDAIHLTDQSVKSVLGALKNTQDKASKEEEETLLKQVLCSTNASDIVEETFTTNSKALLKGTGNWLLEEPFYKSWIAQEAPILWIFGGPGTGKSYLSTWILKQLYERPKVGRTHSVGYFFVKENNETLRDANVILKTLAWQISCQDLDFKIHAITKCRERSHTFSAIDTWENLFLDFYTGAENRRVTLLIDGLDEATAESRLTILGFMKVLVSSPSSSTIQLAIVGRTSLRSDIDFTRLEKIRVVEVSRLKNQKDISSYIKKRLEEFWVLHEMRKMKPDGLKKAKTLGNMIGRKVLDGADGVFLWAKLLLDSLVQKDRAQIEAVLTNPPSTLDDMIRSVFEHLSNDDSLDHDVLRKMLLFTTYSRRPLSFGEVDLITSLPSRKSNYLLWKQTRGILSSVFDMKFPEGFDPDVDDETEEQVSHPTHANGAMVLENTSTSDEEDGFDFDNGDDDDEQGHSSRRKLLSGEDDDDIFSSNFKRQDSSIQECLDNHDDAFEDELIHHLSSGQQHTEVTFCHTRIRDFLIREGNPKTRLHPSLSIIPLWSSSQVEITITCLEIFRLEVSSNRDTRRLCDYPLYHMPLHLDKVDIKSTSRDQQVHILNGLYYIFGTEKGARLFLHAAKDLDEFHAPRESTEFHSPRECAFWRLWVGTDANLKLVQKWFKEAETFKEGTSWGRTMCAWMHTAATSIEDLLRPMMRVASREWLSKPGFDTQDYEYHGEFEASLLHGWLTWIDTGATSPEIETFLSRGGKGGYFFDDLTSERIEQLANWEEHEKDVHWHTCLGWTLMVGQHLEAAAPHFQRAVHLDSNAWVPYEGLARCTATQGQWEEAISWQEKAINAISPNILYMTGYLWPRLSEWAYKVGDLEKARSAAQKGFEVAPSILIAQTRIIYALHEQHKTKELVSVLEKLNSRHVEGKETYSWLVRFFVESGSMFDEIGGACRKEGKPSFVIDALDEALKVVDQGNLEWIKVWLPYTVGVVKHTYYDMDKEALVLWEQFLDRLAQQSQGFQDVYVTERTVATNTLAKIYFDAAVSGWATNTEDAISSAQSLKKLAVAVSTGFQDDYEGFDIYRRDYPAMLWGRWLRDYRKVNEDVWRKCFRTRLLEEMSSLDDDDPTNDTEGLRSLAVSLFHAGDGKNAAALLAILFMHLDKSAKTKPEVSVQERANYQQHAETGLDVAENDLEPQALPAGSDPGSLQSKVSSPTISSPGDDSDHLHLNVDEISSLYSCKGCGDKAPQAAEIHVCEVCGIFNWCDKCLVLLRDSEQRQTLPFHICNPHHDFYRAWPISSEAKYVAAHDFEHGTAMRKEWLEALRRAWWG